MLFGGPGGSTNSVPAGAAADEEDGIAGGRFATKDVHPWSSRDDSTDLHPFGHVAGMVDLRDLSGGKADLVAVGTVSLGGDLADLALGEFTRKGFLKGDPWIASPGHAHGLVDVGAAREGVADGAAQAGGGPAEGFDLSGVIVGLVLEHDQPFFLPAIHVDGHHDAGGVDLA